MSNCKFYSDEFDERCTNADCPYCTEWCPVSEYQNVCRHYVSDEMTNGDKIRSSTDEDLEAFLSNVKNRAFAVGFLHQPKLAMASFVDMEWIKSKYENN